MNVIFYSARCHKLETIFLCYAAHVRPKPRLQAFGYSFATAFRSEYYVVEQTCICHAVFSRPFGTFSFRSSHPALPCRANYSASLRDAILQRECRSRAYAQ